MVRNRYNRIPLPAADTKRERNTRRHKEKQHKRKAKRADGHQAMLNKTDKKSKTNRKRTNNDNYRNIALERSIINYCEA